MSDAYKVIIKQRRWNGTGYTEVAPRIVYGNLRRAAETVRAHRIHNCVVERTKRNAWETVTDEFRLY